MVSYGHVWLRTLTDNDGMYGSEGVKFSNCKLESDLEISYITFFTVIELARRFVTRLHIEPILAG